MAKGIGTFIVSTPGVVGGRPRIDGTRVSVNTIVIWYKKGYNAEEIAEQFERVSLAQVYAALTFYHANQAEIEASLRAEEETHDRLMKEHYNKRSPGRATCL